MTSRHIQYSCIIYPAAPHRHWHLPKIAAPAKEKECPETKGGGVGSALASARPLPSSKYCTYDMMDRRNSARRSNHDVNNSIAYIAPLSGRGVFLSINIRRFPRLLGTYYSRVFLQAALVPAEVWTLPVDLRGVGLSEISWRRFRFWTGLLGGICLVARLMWMFARLGAIGELWYGGCGGRVVGGGGGGGCDVVWMVCLLERLVS